jgi:Short C-terminal domain
LTVLAYDYPLLGLFWTMLWVFLWIAWLMLLFRVFIDIFRSRDMGGGAKAVWSIFVIVVPFLGVFVYLIARGRKMTERDIEEAKNRELAFRSYVQDAAGSSKAGTAEELSKLADLRAKGIITDAEFEQQKAKVLT